RLISGGTQHRAKTSIVPASDRFCRFTMMPPELGTSGLRGKTSTGSAGRLPEDELTRVVPRSHPATDSREDQRAFIPIDSTRNRFRPRSRTVSWRWICAVALV